MQRGCVSPFVHLTGFRSGSKPCFWRSLDQRRFNVLLLASLAVLALILAGGGLYGLISIMTAQRAREIGIRMAFGADRRDVLKLTIGRPF
jgi:hypothetical protein